MNEKDPKNDYIEGLLRDHFKAEVADQPATKHPWDWLRTRLESPSRRPEAVGLLDILYSYVRVVPKSLVATLSVLVVLAGVLMWASTLEEPAYLGDSDNSYVRGILDSQEGDEISQQEAYAVRDSDSPLETIRRFAFGSNRGSSVPAAIPVAPPTASAALPAALPLAPPSATSFKDYERSEFAPTTEDNISTFSLDADRTSFQLALNWARSGHAVDPDSLRAEEWINAFGYGYNPPVHQDSFSITTDVFRHPLNSDMHMVRLGFQAPELQDYTSLNVTLVLDASGSMSDGNRVAIAREAAESIRRSLRSRDRIAVVQFTSDVIHELTVEHTAPDGRAVRRSIDRLVPHASTNVQAGLDLGVKLADRARSERPNAYNYIILMSDGVANVNATDPFAILESAYDAVSSNPLRLITIGVGIENYNDYLLEQLAQHGNGWYRYLSDVDQARATFSRENWLALSIPFADQTRAQVTWNDEVVEYWRMIGYENRVTSDESFVEDRKEFAEIPMGAATTVFFEVQLHDDVLRRPSRIADLGDVQLRWVTPKSGLTNRQSAGITSHLNAELATTGDPLLEFSAIVALASDRYGSLPYVDVNGSSDVRRDLQTLSDRLQSLSHQLGHLDSYRDFAFLLDHMMAALPSDTRSNTGYSR